MSWNNKWWQNSFQVMYLDKVPTYFIKGNRRKPVYHTVLARELMESGWIPEQGSATSGFRPIEIDPKADIEAPATQESPGDPAGEPELEAEPAAEQELVDAIQAGLDSMTKTQLIAFAEQNGAEIKAYATKAELLEICKGLGGG